MTDPATKQKTGAGGPTTAPVVAIYDPKATLDMPPDISAETAMNALAHGVEAVYSPRRTPEAEAIALAAIRAHRGGGRRGRATTVTTSTPAPIMLAGAALAGRCLQNAVDGHPPRPGADDRRPQRHPARPRQRRAAEQSRRVQRARGARSRRKIGEALGDAGDAAGAIDRLRERLGLPAGLAKAGVSDDDIAAVAELAAQNGNVRNNVRRASPEEIQALLESAR